MKKFLALVLSLVMVLSLAACAKTDNKPNSAPDSETEAPVEDADVKAVMTYEEYAAAELDAEVTIEAYVQAKQSWWDNKGTFYLQDENGGYFLYEMPCTEDEYNQLTVGTKVRVTGYKAEWAGEVEIIDATFEILEGNYVAEPIDVTDLLGTDELITKQNMLAVFKGMTVVAIEYKNGEPGDDIYVTLSKDGAEYSFCVERYLTDPDTEVYKAVGELTAGDVIDVTGFVYWYEGVNTHITGVSTVAMTYEEYAAAELDSKVTIEGYVQAKQSWWDNKGTFYLQDENGGYFLYELPCTEDEYNQLTIGTKVKVTGYKAEWAGEVEIIDATFEILEGNYVAEPIDVTDLLGTDELITKQNMLAVFKGMTVVGIEYKNGEPGDDIYVTLSKDGAEYSFCVERYLTDPDTEVYKAVGELKAGDVIDVTGFVYWYEGVNTHITGVSASK